MSRRYLSISPLLSLHLKRKNDWINKRKLCWDKQLLRHAKPELCVLLMNWAYLILETFSSNSIIFRGHNVWRQKTFQKHFLRLLLLTQIIYDYLGSSFQTKNNAESDGDLDNLLKFWHQWNARDYFKRKHSSKQKYGGTTGYIFNVTLEIEQLFNYW